MSFKQKWENIIKKIYGENKHNFEVDYRIKRINSIREDKSNNGFFLNDVAQDILNMANLKSDYKKNLDKIFYKMSVDHDYKNKVYSEETFINNNQLGSKPLSFVDYLCSVSFFFKKEQLEIFFKTVPKELLFNNKITNDGISGEMTPLMMLYSMSIKNFILFLNLCPEYKKELQSFNFFRGQENTFTLNQIFIDTIKKDKVKKAILPYIDFSLFNQDNDALMMLIKLDKNILKDFLENNYIKGNNLFFLMTIFYIEKSIKDTDYFEKIKLLREYSIVSDSSFIENAGVIAQMSPDNLLSIQSHGFLNNLKVNDLIAPLINSVHFGNLDMFEELLKQMDNIQLRSNEIQPDKYDNYKKIILNNSLFNLKNFDNKTHSLEKHIELFISKMPNELMKMKENSDNILIKLFKESKKYILTEKDMLMLKKYNFDLFDKNDNNEDALKFANQENMNMLNKYYFEEMAIKEKENIFSSLNLNDQKIIGVKKRI